MDFVVAALESHLSLLERESQIPPGVSTLDQAKLIQDLVALHLAVFDGLERRLGSEGLTESHRPMVPLFRRWLQTARRLIVWARDLRGNGILIDLDPLLSAINRAKPIAEDFDYFIGLNQGLDRGLTGSYRSLAEVIDELQHEDKQLG